MSDKIILLVEFKISQENLSEVKEICEKGVKIVGSNEKGTLSFDQYFSVDESKMVSLETYRDTQSLLAHLENATENVQRMNDIATISRLEIFGDVTDQLKETLRDFNPVYFKHHSGV
ncbi:MAG: antibiotic biosynthesis monooxygenase [Pseudomonadota bacterium]